MANIFKAEFDFDRINITPSNTLFPGIRPDIKQTMQIRTKEKISFRLIKQLLSPYMEGSQPQS